MQHYSNHLHSTAEWSGAEQSRAEQGGVEWSGAEFLTRWHLTVTKITDKLMALYKAKLQIKSK